MIKRVLFRNLVFISSFLALSACSFDMRSASEKYPSISKNRPLNSPCGKTDSASVKREAQQIKSRDYHADDWAMILSYSLGLEIDSPDFERDMKEMQDIVAGPGNSSYRHTNCQIQKNMSPVYT